MEQTTGDALRLKTWEIYQRLVLVYGVQPFVPRRDPMHELISTMLSHRTTQKNEDVAYHRMMERYGSYEAVRDAPVDQVAETIDVANFPGAKAVNIKEVLRRIIAERGEANIDFLADLPADEGLAWLTALPGVGIKTASLVLLFCFGKPVMPVDTHVHRISNRLGYVRTRTPEKTEFALRRKLPPQYWIIYNDLLVAFGQNLCRPVSPLCSTCPLNYLCDRIGAKHSR